MSTWMETQDYWTQEIKSELSFWKSIDKVLENNVLTQEEAQGLLDSYDEKKYSVMNYSKEQLSSLQTALWLNWDNRLFKNEELQALKEKAKWEFQVVGLEKNNTNFEDNEEFQTLDIDWTQVDNPNHKNERLETVSLLMQSKLNTLEDEFIGPFFKIFTAWENNQALIELTQQFSEHDINDDWITTTWEIMHSIWLISRDDIEEYTSLETKMLDTLSKDEVKNKLAKILKSPNASINVMKKIEQNIPDVFENFKSMIGFSMNAIAKHNNI